MNAEGADTKRQIELATAQTILGIRFTSGDARSAVDAGLRGGLVVVPSAPVLVALETNSALREALIGADLAIADSGLMVLLWRLFQREKITRVSGLEYLRLLLTEPGLKIPNSVLWVMPNVPARDHLLVWLRSVGIPIESGNCYLAPQYPEGKLTDQVLLALVQRQRPAHVIIGLGGGVQERLGFYLKGALDYQPGVHCIGGAIGFLTGDQVRIPRWADYLYLGWLIRCLSDPVRFIPRYRRAWRLVGLLWRCRNRMPPPAGPEG